MKCAVFTRLLKWNQAVGTKSELFRVLCDNADAVVSVTPQIYHAEYIIDALRKFDNDKEEFKAKYKDYAIADILSNVSRWELGGKDGENAQQKNEYWFYTELYAYYCGYKAVGAFVRNILNDANMQTHLQSSQFSNSDRRRIQSTIDKFKILTSKMQDTVCAQVRLSSQVRAGKQSSAQYPEEV
jgi:hypothetical protein